MDAVYDKISITLKDKDNNVYSNVYLTDFTEFQDSIVFTTAVPIDGIGRGWVGTLFYHANGVDIKNGETKVTSVSSVPEVLLARILVSSEPDSCLTWKYEFLKD